MVWNAGQGKKGVLHSLWRFLGFSNFVEFALQHRGLPEVLDGSVKRRLCAGSCPHLLFDVIAQMAFQLIKHSGRMDSTDCHLSPPLRDYVVEVKHLIGLPLMLTNQPSALVCQ